MEGTHWTKGVKVSYQELCKWQHNLFYKLSPRKLNLHVGKVLKKIMPLKEGGDGAAQQPKLSDKNVWYFWEKYVPM